MIVNANSLRDNINKLQTTIADYDTTHLNLYNELIGSHQYANSNDFTKFYENVEEEKKATLKFRSEIKTLCENYEYICNSYSEIGNTVEYDLGNQDALFNKINIIKQQLVLLKRKNSGISMYPEITSLINDNINKITNIENNINQLEAIYSANINKICEIERNVSHNINNFDIDVVKETDISEFI